MSKNKISKISLLSYLDGELDDGQCKQIKDYLMDSEEDTHFLEDVVKVENLFLEKEEISVSDDLRNTILKNANELLEKKRILIQHKHRKRKRVERLVIQIKDDMPKIEFKISYEYVALCSLLIIFMSLLRTPTYQGDVIAFKIRPQVVSAETTYEYNENKNDYNDYEGEEVYE